MMKIIYFSKTDSDSDDIWYAVKYLDYSVWVISSCRLFLSSTVLMLKQFVLMCQVAAGILQKAATGRSYASDRV